MLHKDWSGTWAIEERKQKGGGTGTLDTSRPYGSKTSYLLIHVLIKCINTHLPYRRCDSESSPANLSNT